MTRPRIGMDAGEDQERRTSRYLVWGTALTLALALAWASVFRLDEVTRGQGKVIPSSREQVVQSLDSGVLSELLVQEGSRVKKGQVLLRLDDARSGPVYREAFEKKMALAAQAARLRAEAYGIDLTFPAETPGIMIKRERQAFDARRQALQQSVSALTTSMSMLSREIEMTEPLTKQGVMSEVELLRLKRQRSDFQGQIAERRNRYLTDASNELVRVESELSQTRENASAREDALRRTVVYSPMDGVVKNVQVTTLGGVIQAGQAILEIVPTEDAMLVEAYIKPAEVAFLRIGQPAVVKLSAYDFNKYGGFDGVLEHLSPDTLSKEDRQRRPGNPVDLEEGFYRILVRLPINSVERHGRELIASPGMTATVEIRTGQKTVLEYLFRPLQSVSQALRER